MTELVIFDDIDEDFDEDFPYEDADLDYFDDVDLDDVPLLDD